MWGKAFEVRGASGPGAAVGAQFSPALCLPPASSALATDTQSPTQVCISVSI